MTDSRSTPNRSPSSIASIGQENDAEYSPEPLPSPSVPPTTDAQAASHNEDVDSDPRAQPSPNSGTASITPKRHAEPGWLSWTRRGCLAVVLLAMTFVFWSQLDSHYPIGDWIFWKYLKGALGALYFLVGCALFGVGSIRTFAPSLHLAEQWTFGVSFGVYSFYVLQMCAGLLGLFGPGLALTLPALMSGFGLWRCYPLLTKLWQKRRLLPLRFGVRRGLDGPLVAFGFVAIAILYAGILHPRNAAFDSLWYHLGLGEGWAAEGGIFRTPEGWYMSTLPNMAAVLYSYAFLLPTYDLFETMMVAAHQEFLLFLVTLSFIPVVVKALLPKAKVGATWVALFLFPSLFIYDAGLHSGNDHVAAFWSLPLFLGFLRFWKKPNLTHASLLALCASGAALTKYQTASILIGPGLAAVGRVLWLTIKGWRTSGHQRFGPAKALTLTTGLALLLTSPHWLRNWIWYGDPLYPALNAHLKLHPWSDDAAAYLEMMWNVNVWRPKGTFIEQLTESLPKSFTFSFESHAHHAYHKDWPYVGSLFTLSLAWLPFLKGNKRVWGLALCTQLGVFTWYYLSHVERYLQILLPWMATCVAATLILTWKNGWLARLPMLLLVALQLVWGGDAISLRGHAMLHDAPMVSALRMIETGYRGNLKGRGLPAGSVFEPIGNLMPEGSKLLLHDHNGRLGLKHSVVVDKPRYQALLRYGEMHSAKQMHDMLVGLGVTHVVWKSKSTGYPTMAADLRFFDFAQNLLTDRKRVDNFLISPLPQTMPPYKENDVVLYAGCRNTFARGLFHLTDMNELDNKASTVRHKKGFKLMPQDVPERLKLLEQAHFLVYSRKCNSDLPYPAPGFRKAGYRRDEEIWVRPWQK